MSDWGLVAVLSLMAVVALGGAMYPLYKSSTKAIWILPIILGLVIGTYVRWGGFTEWRHYLQQQSRLKEVQAMLKSIRNPQELAERLIEQLKHRPDARGWYLLGRVYASQTQWQLAEAAFAKAYELSHHQDVQITVNYAQSIWQHHHQTFDAETRTLFQSVLAQDPHQPDALAMLAMDAFLRQDYQQAIDYWGRLLKLVPPQSEDAEAIQKAIVKAHQRMSD